jgi:hypothetical protein
VECALLLVGDLTVSEDWQCPSRPPPGFLGSMTERICISVTLSDDLLSNDMKTKCAPSL